MTNGQAAVLEFLARPSSYPDAPGEVRRLDTHSASVFLAGSRAWKLKREIRYSFLDYSTLDARLRACEAELRLNRRTAPDLYLDVTPVTRDATGELSIGGQGEPVEWLVVMRRFPDDALLDQVAVDGRFTLDLAARLADEVASFHAGAARAPHEGGADSMREVVDDNTRALTAAADIVSPADVNALAVASAEALERHAARIDARRAGGFVRQCHGDLHLRNIVLLDGTPTLFDAIEFNDTFACIDVWYDLAFLLMVLLARGLRAEASVLFNQYLLQTGDVDGLPLLPLFLATRAAVRAKTSIASARLEEDADARRAFEDRAREYLKLAVRLGTPVAPRLVAVGGRSGSGKSTLAAALAPAIGGAPGAVVLRSDVLRKLLLHRAPEEHLGADGYTAAVTARVYGAMAGRAADILARGWSVIADATWLDAAAREGIEAVAVGAGVPFDGLWLEAPTSLAAGRLERRVNDASDATADVLDLQLRVDAGAMAWAKLDAAVSLDDLVAAARARIGHS